MRILTTQSLSRRSASVSRRARWMRTPSCRTNRTTTNPPLRFARPPRELPQRRWSRRWQRGGRLPSWPGIIIRPPWSNRHSTGRAGSRSRIKDCRSHCAIRQSRATPPFCRRVPCMRRVRYARRVRHPRHFRRPRQWHRPPLRSPGRPSRYRCRLALLPSSTGSEWQAGLPSTSTCPHSSVASRQRRASLERHFLDWSGFHRP